MFDPMRHERIVAAFEQTLMQLATDGFTTFGDMEDDHHTAGQPLNSIRESDDATGRNSMQSVDLPGMEVAAPLATSAPAEEGVEGAEEGEGEGAQAQAPVPRTSSFTRVSTSYARSSSEAHGSSAEKARESGEERESGRLSMKTPSVKARSIRFTDDITDDDDSDWSNGGSESPLPCS